MMIGLAASYLQSRAKCNLQMRNDNLHCHVGGVPLSHEASVAHGSHTIRNLLKH